MLSNSTLTSRRECLTDILYLTVIILVFYTFWLGSYPLFTPDEGRYSEVAREMIVTGDFITPRVNGVAFLDKPILYYWLQALAIGLFGIKEWAIRLFPALLGVLGCVTTYFCGRELFNRRTGLLAASILATMPLYFVGAHYANLDLEVAVWISGSLLFFITAIQSKKAYKKHLFIASYLFAAFAFLTKGLIGLAFPSMIVGTWILLLSRWDVLKKMYLILGISLFIAIVLPWYVLVQQANPAFLHYFFVTQQVTRFLSASEFNNQSPFWFYIPIVLIGMFPWTIFLLQTLKKSIHAIWYARKQHATELFLLLWIAIIFVFFSIPHSKTISYILPIMPALALLIGQYIACQWKQMSTISSTYFLVLGLLIAATLIAMPHYQWLELAPGLTPYLSIMASILFVSTIIAYWYRKTSLLTLFAICTSSSALCLLLLTMSASHLNQNSTKLLAAQLKTIIQPQDEIVNYFKFYQDVPMYLERRVTLVANWQAPDIAYKDNWVRELWFGMPFQNTSAWLINEDEFWKRWHSDKRIFVFVNNNYLEQFKTRAQYYFFLDKINDIILLSNKPTLLVGQR